MSRKLSDLMISSIAGGLMTYVGSKEDNAHRATEVIIGVGETTRDYQQAVSRNVGII